MDVLYTGEIPSSFHYAVFSDNHIDLYDRNVLNNGTFPYYRIYKNYNGFYYSQGSTNISQYNYTYTTDIKISDKIYYRNDYSSILTITFIIVLFFTFLFNIITSIFRKGGVLGGLL